MARTTIDLDPGVLRELRRRGRREHKSMGQVVSETLTRAFGQEPSAEPDSDFRWISRDLGKPRVDLEDKEALRAVMEAAN
jgi:hypothetical protein